MTEHTCSLSTREAEGGEHEFKATLSNIQGLCFKQKQKEANKKDTKRHFGIILVNLYPIKKNSCHQCVFAGM